MESEIRLIRTSSDIYPLDEFRNLFSYAQGKNLTIAPIEWKGMYFSIHIAVKGDCSNEATMMLMQDLMDQTIKEHASSCFKPLLHVPYESNHYGYRGITVLHETFDEAIDYANYVRIRANS
jgi:hypothetical protein